MDNTFNDEAFKKGFTESDFTTLEEIIAELAGYESDEGDACDHLEDNLESEPVETLLNAFNPAKSEPQHLPEPAMPMQWHLQVDEPAAAVYEFITIPPESYKPQTTIQVVPAIKYDNLDGLAECDILGIKMLRNAAELTKIPIKAQAKVLMHRREGNIVIARIYKPYATKPEFRTWGQCSQDKLLSLTDKDNSIYEIIADGVYPYKPYFDIDEPYIEGGSLDISDYANRYIDILTTIFKNADIAVSGNISTKKASLHIVISNYVIRNLEEKQQLVHIANFIKSDISVYAKNSLMKLLNQAKPPPDNIRKQQPIGIVGDKVTGYDPRKHIITAFINPNSYNMPNWKRAIENTKSEANGIAELKLQLYGRTLATPFDLSEVPKAILNLDILDFDIYTATAEQLVNIYPLNDTKDHTYTSKIALFCFHHIGGEDGINVFLKWRLSYKRIKTGEAEADLVDRWRRWFTLIPTQRDTGGGYIYKPISVENLRWALLQNNPELHRDKFLNKFSNTYNDNIFNHCDRLTVERLDYKHYDHNSRKYVIANIGMCGGKTAQTAKYLLENVEKPFIWIVNKIALAQNTCERLRAEDLRVHNYKQRREGARADLNNSNNLLVCLNSLYLAEPLLAKNKIVVIDEIESFLITWFNNPTLNNTRVDKGRLWRLLLQILRSAEKVIFLDAFISSHTISFIKMLAMEDIAAEVPLLIKRPCEKTSRKVQFLSKYHKWIGDILDDLERGEKPFIFYPYYKEQEKPIKLPSMEGLHKLLIEETKRRTGRDIKGLYYNGQIDQLRTNELYNVGEAWDNIDFVITNTKITVGVSYEGENAFNKCYILALGWVEPRDIIQVSYRARTLKDDLIKICILSTFNINMNFKYDGNYITDMQNRVENSFCPIYQNLVEGVLCENFCPYEQKLLLFIKLAGYTIIDGDAATNMMMLDNLKNFLKGEESKHLYDKIRNIKEEEIELIKKKLHNNEATEREQIEFKKYEFNSFFKDSAEIELGSGVDGDNGEYIADVMSEKQLDNYKAAIWDKKYFQAMDYVRFILVCPHDRNYKIFNEFKNMFNGSYVPTAEQLTEIMRKKVKLNEDLLDLIFGNKAKEMQGDHFRTIKRTSATIHIIKHIYNTTFGKKLISVSKVRHQPTINIELENIIIMLPLILQLPEIKINTEGESDQTEPERFINYSSDEESEGNTTEDENTF